MAPAVLVMPNVRRFFPSGAVRLLAYSSRMNKIWLLAFAMGCGSVTNTSGIDAGTCEPGQALSCDGDDLVVCADDGASTSAVPCANGCSSEALACRCEANTSTCEGTTEVQCSSDGLATMRECPAGCFDDTRCSDIAPSNRLTQFLESAETGPDLDLPAGTIIDTATGEIIVDGLALDIESTLLEAPPDPGGLQVRVWAVGSLAVSGDVLTRGFPALAIVSNGDIELNAVIRALAGGGPDGNGAGGGFSNCGTGVAHISGQGGGGFGAPGGKGGDIINGPAGGAGGQAVGNEEIIPLRGGGHNAGLQLGGGAIQLVSRTAIRVRDGGAINAGGRGGPFNNGGGGAGGGILLEAPAVEVSGAGSALAANGGGGGCGTSSTPVVSEAEDGRLDTQRAKGCVSPDRPDGGLGGAGDGPTAAGGVGESQSGCPMTAGAGGGGVGRIRVNTASGSFAPSGGAIVTPSASAGMIGLR